MTMLKDPKFFVLVSLGFSFLFIAIQQVIWVDYEIISDHATTSSAAISNSTAAGGIHTTTTFLVVRDFNKEHPPHPRQQDDMSSAISYAAEDSSTTIDNTNDLYSTNDHRSSSTSITSSITRNSTASLTNSAGASAPAVVVAAGNNTTSSTATICQLQKPLDEITYAALQKLRQGYIHNLQILAAMPTDIPKPRIFCMVYTHAGAHDTYLRAVVDTWAKHCDGFLAASNVTDPSLHAIQLEFPGPESYDNLWQKVVAMWMYVHEHYINDYDYFHICGDDTFVIPENMQLYFMSQQVKDLMNGHMDVFSIFSSNTEYRDQWKNARPRPLLFGFPIQALTAHGYMAQYPAGGSGYTLNQEAVRSFYKIIQEHPSTETDPREDFLISERLATYGITCSDTRDTTGAFRYVPNNFIAEYKCMHKWPGPKRRGSQMSHCHDGLDAFSYETVSIHINYRKGKWLPKIVNYTEEVMYRFYDFLTGKCDDILLSHVPNTTKMDLIHNTAQRGTHRFTTSKRAKVLEENHAFGLSSS